MKNENVLLIRKHYFITMFEFYYFSSSFPFLNVPCKKYDPFADGAWQIFHMDNLH